MRGNLRGFGDDGGVEVADFVTALVENFSDPFEEGQTADAGEGGVGVGKMMADVSFADGSEEGIHDGVAEDVGVGVAFESSVGGDFDAPKNERSAFDEAVDVIAGAGAWAKGRFI
jgi:hypothetical protein